MARIRCSTDLVPVPRGWFEQTIAALFDLAEHTTAHDGRIHLPDGQLVPDVRLADGRHLRPGAVYEDEGSGGGHAQSRISVREWDRRGGVRLHQSLQHEQLNVTLEGTLRSVERPRTMELTVNVDAGPSWATRLLRTSVAADVELDAWWRAVEGRRTARPLLTVRVRRRWTSAVLHVTPRPRDGQWEVCCRLTVRGRALMRPVVAVALMLARGALKGAMAKTLEQIAAEWNRTVPDLVTLDANQIRRRAAVGLAVGAGEKTVEGVKAEHLR
ncbi:hypothetical protein [Streptomyces mesophilus]|uniref:hypothetical protein n=1 Tax=Streptomyces mesophilus TaxID=1775132 RepID=UPI00332AE94A